MNISIDFVFSITYKVSDNRNFIGGWSSKIYREVRCEDYLTLILEDVLNTKVQKGR